MWVIGGSGRNDVWWSTNGLEWTLATESIHWGLPSAHATVIYDNKIFAVGGLSKNEVWWTTDGATWTQTSANAEWGRRTNHDVIVYKNAMWLMGGNYGTAIYGDVWKSAVSSSSAIQYPPTVIRDSATSFSTPLSVYDMASYQWQFGDGQTATGANPIHTYAESGTYTVTLTIPDEVNGLQTTYTKPITVVAGEGLTAGFTTSQRSGTPPLTVQFVDTSTGNPTAWAWNFGDGSATSNTRNPSHTYASIGSYTVSLYVENAEDSDWEVKTNYITVSSFPPIIASPTFNTTIQYDMANGTYLQYWLFNVTTFGDIPVYGFAYGIMAPLMNVWGYWVFVMFWFAYLFIVWIRTSDIGLPIVIGLLTAGVWGLFFPPEAMQFAYLMFGLSIAALLTKLAIEYL
jgi:PKD repeat protein